MKISVSMRGIAKPALLLVFLIGILALPVSLDPEIGSRDFRPYWSSSFLLRNGRDFSDLSGMDFIERSRTNWDEPYTMRAWFAPTGNLILLPYTFLPFARAVYFWLITNIFVVFFSALLLWHGAGIKVWVPIGVFFGFSATLLSLYMGQVNTLVLLGLALFIFFDAKKRRFLAGTCLILATIKPHLVILTLPLLLLDAVWRKDLKLLAGFISALVICAAILWSLYPPWLDGFWRVITSGMNNFRESPTAPGLLVRAGCGCGKWLWLAALALATIIWWKVRDKINRRILMDVTILAGMIVSPIGWSYDQIVLLVPLCHIIEWMAGGALRKRSLLAVAWVLTAANLASFYQRALSLSDVWFFWIPLIVMIVYAFAWKQKQINSGVPSGAYSP